MISLKTLLFSLLLTRPTVSLPTDGVASRSICPPGAQIFIARATDELSLTGISAVVAAAIAENIPGTTIFGIPYPATAGAYSVSEGIGVQSLKTAVEDFVEACPDTWYYLIGYSQGAQVVMDNLCGTSEVGFVPTDPLDSSVTSHMLGAIVFGDPSHIVGQSYDIGTATKNGIFPRVNTQPCQQYAQRLASFCDFDDPFCASGVDELVHLSYIGKYNTTATDWGWGRYLDVVG